MRKRFKVLRHEKLREEYSEDSENDSQAAQDILLTKKAIREGWATPDTIKPDLVDEIVSVALDPTNKPRDRVAAFRALTIADKEQYERDHPKSQDTGPTTLSINIGVIPANGQQPSPISATNQVNNPSNPPLPIKHIANVEIVQEEKRESDTEKVSNVENNQLPPKSIANVLHTEQGTKELSKRRNVLNPSRPRRLV